MLSRCIALAIGVTVVGMATRTVAQTPTSWQEWVKKNPTYPTLQGPPSQTSTGQTSAGQSSTGKIPAPAQDWDQALPKTSDDKIFTDGFMKSCTAGAPQAYCSCMLGKMKSRYTLTEMMDIGIQFRQTRTIPSSLLDMAKVCVAQVSK
jgi:hypothetical protein